MKFKLLKNNKFYIILSEADTQYESPQTVQSIQSEESDAGNNDEKLEKKTHEITMICL